MSGAIGQVWTDASSAEGTGPLRRGQLLEPFTQAASVKCVVPLARHGYDGFVLSFGAIDPFGTVFGVVVVETDTAS